MRLSNPFLALAVATVVLATFPAKANMWDVDHDSSTLTFTISIGGEEASGAFDRWTAEIHYDPATPEAGRVRINVDTTSVTIADGRAQGGISSGDWLGTETFPTAVFEGDGFALGEGDSFQLDGTLSLKEATLPTTLEGMIRIANGLAMVETTTSIDRAAFGVGVGQDSVGPQVRITATVVANAVPE